MWKRLPVAGDELGCAKRGRERVLEESLCSELRYAWQRGEGNSQDGGKRPAMEWEAKVFDSGITGLASVPICEATGEQNAGSGDGARQQGARRGPLSSDEKCRGFWEHF